MHRLAAQLPVPTQGSWLSAEVLVARHLGRGIFWVDPHEPSVSDDGIPYDAVWRDAKGEPRLPTGDDLPRLEYTRQVLAEVLRLYPPLWAHCAGGCA